MSECSCPSALEAVKAARDLLENVTPLPTDCGAFCSAACCKDDPDYETSGMLLFPGEEDFGIIPVEAMSAGVPVIAYGRGGATETVVDGETGLLFSEQTPESLAEALQRFEQCEGDFDPRHLHAHAEKFSTENFLTGFRHEVEAAMARM